MRTPTRFVIPLRRVSLLILAVALSCVRSQAATPIPSFPGAVGYGAATTGAWSLTGTNHTGGTVYHVTNLNDSGAGSFRTGVGTSGNIVVFDVGGSIQNLSAVSVASNVSIEGQTAPGGIQVFGAETSFYGSSNDIVRYMHFRDGTLDPNYPGSSATNSHTNAVNLGDTQNMILDHCTFEFAAYNNIDSAGAVNVTISNCIFADPIREQQFNLHFETGPVTMIGNLWANSHGRNPLGKGDMQYVNNVVYNYQYAMTTGNSSGNFHWDVVNNYFIAGPSTTNANDCYYQVDSNQSAYAIGNYLDGNKNGVLDGGAANTVNGATVLTNYWFPNSTETIATTSLPTVSAAAAFYEDISNAGPLPHDQVDEQVVGNVLSIGTQGMLWGNQTSTGLGNDGYGVITSGTALPDSDASGMPDDWKAAVGISMTNPAAGETTSSTGYTYLENYLAWKALPNAWVAKNTAAQPTSVIVNLSQYADGFGTGATYTVSGAVKGTATQSGSAPYLVTFVPTTGTTGLGGFNWTVSNSTATMSSTCGILISQGGPAQSVRWKGDGMTNAWDLTTSNWTSINSGIATDFGAGDPVTFDDTGSVSPSVNIDTAVSPGSMTFNTYANSYTLTGTGSIGGTGSLIKEGTASLTISNSGGNSFSGGAEIDGGTIYMNNGSALGSGQTTLNGGDLEISSNISLGEPIAVNEASTLGLDAHNSNTFLGSVVSGNAPLAFNFNNSGIVCSPSGDWSGYTGVLTISGGGNFRIDNSSSWGFPNASVIVTGGLDIYNRSGGAATIPFGALNAGSTADLGGSDQGGAAGTLVNYTIGSLNLPSTFAGNIGNSGQIVGITKTGNSTLTLSGSGTYTGPTNINSGTFLLTGSLGSTNVTVSSGASMISNSIVSGTVTLGGGSLYLGNSSVPGVIGTFTLGNGFVVNGGNIYYDLSNSPTATGSNDLITVTNGSLSLNDTINFEINMTNGALGAGTYHLINGNAALGVNSLTMNLVLPIPAGGVTRQTFGLIRPASGSAPGYLNLSVTGNAGSLVWTGTSGGTWDLNTTSDWSGASPATFYDLDTVTFNDTDTTNGVVALSGTLQPNVINVTNNVTNYTFSGSGALVGNTELIKSGLASLTVANTGGNSFTGPVYLNAGALYANSFYALGDGTLYLDGGTLYVDNGTYLGNPIVVETTSTIYASGGSDWITNNAGATLSSTGPVTLFIGVANGSAFTIVGNMDQFQGTFEMGGSAGLVRLDGDGSSQAVFDIGSSSGDLANRNGNITANFGGLEGGPNTVLQGRQAGSGATTSTYIVGALNENQTFAGTISNGGDEGGLNLTKVGTGNWTLSGTSNFAGDITIAAGTLTITGSCNNAGLDFIAESGGSFVLGGGTINTETVQIFSGATFTGYGTIDAAIVNQGVSTVTGPLTINGNFENDGTLTVTGSGSLVTNLPTDGSGSFVNNGLLDIMDSPTTALPAGYVNNGTILTSALVTVKQFSKSGGTFTVSIQSYTGHTYQLQKSTDLQTWQNVGSAQAGTTGSPVVLTDTNASAAGSFYQIAVGP